MARFGGPKREPKWSQIGHQNGSKISTASGAILDINLVHFRGVKMVHFEQGKRNEQQDKDKMDLCANTTKNQLKTHVFPSGETPMEVNNGQKGRKTMFENTSANRDTKWLPNGVILAPVRAPNLVKIGVQNRAQKLKLKKKVTRLQVNPKETPRRPQGGSWPPQFQIWGPSNSKLKLFRSS